MSLALRPYQRESIDAIGEALERGIRCPLVSLPTGTGKTVVFSRLIQERGGTALILAHRDELLQQAAEKLTSVAPELGMSIGFVKGKMDDTTAPVVVASVQTLGRPNRLMGLPRDFDTVVCDEAHHAAAATYKRIFEHLDSPLIAGFTATPERADRKRLSDVWEEIVYARSIEEMIREGYLCDLRGLRVGVDVGLGDVKQTAGEFQAEDLGRALHESGAVEEVVESYVQHGEGRKAILFAPTVELAYEMAAGLRGAGVSAEAVEGATEAEERRGILRRLHSGETQVVANVGVLTEGFDEPSVSCVIVAGPTRSRIKYAQMIGRGTRLHPGKEDCLILDVAGASDELTIQSLPAFFGVEDPEEGETITMGLARTAAAQQARAKQEKAKADAVARDRQSRVGQMPRAAKAIDFFARDRVHWLQTSTGRWVLPAGDDDLLFLIPAEDSWQVFIAGKRRARALARNLDLGYAQGVAEEVIRNRGAVALADKQATWRQKPTSDGQRSYLERLGLDVPETKGEAADLLTIATATKRVERLERKLAVREAVAA